MIPAVLVLVGLTGPAVAGGTDEVPFMTDGVPAPYTAAVPFSRSSGQRILSCADGSCVYRGGAGERPQDWPGSGGCEVRGTVRSERWLGFVRACWDRPRTEQGARWEVGVVELASGVATWRSAPVPEGDSMPHATDLALSAGEHLLWVRDRSPFPSMVATEGRAFRLPGIVPVAVHGDVTRASVEAADGVDDEIVTGSAVPDIDPRWAPVGAFEVVSFAESKGGCLGVWGAKPRGCQLEMRWLLDAEAPRLVGWRVAYCYTDSGDEPRPKEWLPLNTRVFVRPGPDPRVWRWSGLPPGYTPCAG